MNSKRVLNIFLVIILGIAVGFGFFFVTSKIKPSSGLSVDAFPKAKVLVNGKEEGTTPFYRENLKDGDYSVRLVSSEDPSVSFDVKVKLVPGVVTLIQHILNKDSSLSSTKIVYLEKTANSQSASLSLVSDPDGAMVKVDGEAKGTTPLLLKDLSAGGKDITFSKPGFADTSLKGFLFTGYELNAFVKMPQTNEQQVVASPGGTPNPSVTPPVVTSVQEKSKTAQQPVASASATTSVVILDTPTGFLRVRNEPSSNASESGRVIPGEKYDYLGEVSGWIKIQFKEKVGWVSATYTKKI